MFALTGNGVNDLYPQGVALLSQWGEKQPSRAGEVLALPAPLAVTYERPWERVLFDEARNANWALHLFESLWLLAGRNDAKWLDQFVGDFSERFAEPDGVLHGSYGFRWRKHFDLEGGGSGPLPDQLETVTNLLRANPKDRRVVIQMWDPVADLGSACKDVPCNLTVVPRIVQGKLDITIFNRSNDLLWGLMGSNTVQFSVLLEYLAGRIGVPMGKQAHISTNAHLYLATMPKTVACWVPPYPGTIPMGSNWDAWDEDLHNFMAWTDAFPLNQGSPVFSSNPWFRKTAQPLFEVHYWWKMGKRLEAYDMLVRSSLSIAPDWRLAAEQWMLRRLEKAK